MSQHLPPLPTVYVILKHLYYYVFLDFTLRTFCSRVTTNARKDVTEIYKFVFLK